MTSCPFCGETSFYPQGPHPGRPCPLKQREHEARLAALEAVTLPEDDEGVTVTIDLPKSSPSEFWRMFNELNARRRAET